MNLNKKENMTRNILILTVILLVMVSTIYGITRVNATAAPTVVVNITPVSEVTVIAKPSVTPSGSSITTILPKSPTATKESVVLGPIIPHFDSGFFDIQNGFYTGTRTEPVFTMIPPSVDPRLDKLLNPSMELVIWDPKDMNGFDKDGATYIKTYRGVSAEMINEMNYATRQQFVAYVDKSKIILPSTSTDSSTETEKIFKNRFPDGGNNSFVLDGKISNSNYQLNMTFIAISNPKSPGHTITINGHTIHYIDILVNIPGKGLVKQGLAVGADSSYETMFRGTAKYTHTSKTDNYLGMFTIPTKFIFSTTNADDYSIRYEINQWNKDTSLDGMPLTTFYVTDGETPYGNMRIGAESIKYLPYLPANYYEEFLKSGGTSFVVIFPGDDVMNSNMFEDTVSKPFTDEEIKKIRSEWNENGKSLK